MKSDGPNAEQITYWNEQAGPVWVAEQRALDAMLEPLGRVAMERAAIEPGTRVLDVGCGAGYTTLQLGERVGPSGSALGIDLSLPMLERARERARAAGLGHVSFEQADAQLEPLHDFDRVFSRFGVMFFADPVDAFANLRRALGPGGRIAFICWRPVAENPWIHEPMRILAELVEIPAPAPGAPGPFSLGARERLEHVLERARFADLDVERLDLPLLVGGGGVEQALHFLLQVGPASRVLREHPEIVEQASVSLRALLEKHAGPDGVRMDSASWVVTARA